MALSRFRLRLTAGFAVAFLAGLAVLDGLLILFVTQLNNRNFNVQLEAAAAASRTTVTRDAGAVRIRDDVGDVVTDAMSDWAPADLVFQVYGPHGRLVAAGGPPDVAAAIPDFASLPPARVVVERLLPGRQHLRFVVDTALGARLVVGATTEGLAREREGVLLRMLVSAPLALLLALTIGYLLSRFTLRPIAALGEATAAIAPGPLAGRLPVGNPPDELDRLAIHFNDLLARIAALQAQSQRFVREAAHQIRTPLTVVLGEADLALERARTPEEYVAVLRRVRAAAGQMQHRVRDLFLLARMESGDQPPMTESVELDALALEVADLFRGRAQQLGQRIELGRVIPVTVPGNGGLLREAVLELLENACRHGEPNGTVTISVTAEPPGLEIRNAGPAIPELHVEGTPAGPRNPDHGLGLAIVRWIAGIHRGGLEIARDGAANVVTLRLGTAS